MKYLLFSQIWLVLHGLVSDSVLCICDAQYWGGVTYLWMSDEIQMLHVFILDHNIILLYLFI